MPVWDAPWSLPSLQREGNSYGQEAPTQEDEDEGVVAMSAASKQRAIGSVLPLPEEEQHGVVPAGWQILDPQALCE